MRGRKGNWEWIFFFKIKKLSKWEKKEKREKKKKVKCFGVKLVEVKCNFNKVLILFLSGDLFFMELSCFYKGVSLII